MFLIAGSCITLGRLLAGAAPLTLLKIGIVAMAIVDSILVFGNQLQGPNATLIAAVPAHGLPQLQSASFIHAGLGYGDFFAAGVLGGVLAAEGRAQLAAAIGVLAASVAWDQLFRFYDTMPATVPVAFVLVVDRAQGRMARKRNAANSTRCTPPSCSVARPGSTVSAPTDDGDRRAAPSASRRGRAPAGPRARSRRRRSPGWSGRCSPSPSRARG